MGAETDVENCVKDVTGKEIGEESRQATEFEHSMTFEALKLYPTSAAWSVFSSLGIIMTAFDPQLLGNLYATPAFQNDFGYLYEGSYIISAAWEILLGRSLELWRRVIRWSGMDANW